MEIFQLFFEVCGLIAVCCVLVGTRLHKPQRGEIWYGLAATIAIFVVSFGLRLIFPSQMMSVASGAPRPADYVDMIGLTFVVGTLFLQSRVRDDSGDSTTVIDSIVIAGGISALIWVLQVYPALHSHTLATSAKLIALYMGVLLSGLAFCAGRLALTFRTRNAATFRLIVAIALGVVAGIFATGTAMKDNNTMILLAAGGVLFLGSAALHPSMTELTSPGDRDRRWIPAGRINPKRAIITAPALLIAPVALLVEIAMHRATILNATYLVTCQVAVTAFVLFRLVKLMKLRERSTAVDQIVTSTVSSLAASPTTSDTCTIATSAMIELLQPNANVIAFLALLEDGDWNVAGSGGSDIDLKGVHLPRQVMDRLLYGDADFEDQLADLLGQDRSATPIITVVPLTSRQEVRGALIAFSAKRTSVVNYTALQSLTTGIVMSLDAITSATQSDDLDALLGMIHPDDHPAFSQILQRARGHERRERFDTRAFRIGTGSEVRWFSLNYQPIFQLEDLKLVGFEALLRWVHPTLGLVPPDSFIPLAEETGAIIDIGKWALRKACEQLAQWDETYERYLFMSVNVSNVQLKDETIADHVESTIDEVGIQPSRLIVELSNACGLEDATSREQLTRLNAIGCGVAADDFGAGFGSYDALQHLPFSAVKVDHKLIAGRPDVSEALRGDHMKWVVEMAHWLGMSVTAKGVEDLSQLDRLVWLDTDFVQGYLTGPPLPASEAAESYLQGPAAKPGPS